MLKPDTVRLGRIRIDIDTIQFTYSTSQLIRIIDSAIAASGGADTTKLVSMNRDDAAIRGEKTFLGVAGFKFFGQFNLTGGERRAVWMSHDTATKRLGDTVLTAASVGAGQQSMQLYSSGIFDLPKQSSVRAYRNGNQACAATDSIDFNAENFDTQSEFDSGTLNEFVAKQGGIYLVSATMYGTFAAGGFLDVYVRVNYTDYAFMEGPVTYNSVTYSGSVTVTTLVQLNKEGRIGVRFVAPNTGTIIGASDATYISIIKVM